MNKNNEVKKGKIVVDFDDVLVEGGFLKLANKCFGENKNKEDIKSYYIEDNYENLSKEKLDEFYDILVTENIYENHSYIITKMYDAIKKLSRDYEIIIFSACAMINRKDESGICFLNKYNYIIKNFDFVDPSNIILGGNKSIICADYFIDDKLSNLIDCRAKYKMLYTSYHNKEITDTELKKHNIKRINDGDEFYNYIINNDK